MSSVFLLLCTFHFLIQFCNLYVGHWASRVNAFVCVTVYEVIKISYTVRSYWIRCTLSVSCTCRHARPAIGLCVGQDAQLFGDSSGDQNCKINMCASLGLGRIFFRLLVYRE